MISTKYVCGALKYEQCNCHSSFASIKPISMCLTITLPDIFMGILIPKLLIIVIEAHKGENYLKKQTIKSRLQQRIHTILRDAGTEKKIIRTQGVKES